MRNPYVWAPINLGDWSRATDGLTLEEQGAVLKLLLAYWDDGEFTPDRLIPKVLGVSGRKWLAMQEHVAAAMNRYLDRSGFMDERIRAAKTSEGRRKAINNRWAKYRQNATQGLDTNVLQKLYQPQPHTEVHTDKAQKPAMGHRLGEQAVGDGAGADTSPRPGKLNGHGRRH